MYCKQGIGYGFELRPTASDLIKADDFTQYVVSQFRTNVQL